MAPQNEAHEYTHCRSFGMSSEADMLAVEEDGLQQRVY